MVYHIKGNCIVCGEVFWTTIRNPKNARQTCGNECKSQLVCTKNAKPFIQCDPTPEQIQEMCARIRSGEIVVEGYKQVVVDSEIKNRRHRANTFIRQNRFHKRRSKHE